MREGLKLQEVHLIASALKQNLEDGETEEVAYALACRAVSGVLPAVFKKWREDIFKLARGERTALDPLPAKVKPTPPGGMAAALTELTETNARLAAEAKERAAEMEKLKAEIAKLKK
jgi:hypothetical protein